MPVYVKNSVTSVAGELMIIILKNIYTYFYDNINWYLLTFNENRSSTGTAILLFSEFLRQVDLTYDSIKSHKMLHARSLQ